MNLEQKIRATIAKKISCRDELVSDGVCCGCDATNINSSKRQNRKWMEENNSHFDEETNTMFGYIPYTVTIGVQPQNNKLRKQVRKKTRKLKNPKETIRNEIAKNYVCNIPRSKLNIPHEIRNIINTYMN